jgi:hypothetical protein
VPDTKGTRQTLTVYKRKQPTNVEPVYIKEISVECQHLLPYIDGTRRPTFH